MLDVGNINSVIGRASSTSVQSSGAAGGSAPSKYVAVPTKNDDIVYVISRVRVDNLQDIAILEYRSEQGEVKEQFPTDKQIQAFKEAERLEARRQEKAALVSAVAAPKSESVSLNTSESSTATPTAAQLQQAVSVPSTTAPATTPSTSAPDVAVSAPSTSAPSTSGNTGSSEGGTSILV